MDDSKKSQLDNKNNPAVDRALNIFEYLSIVKNASIKEISDKLEIPHVSTSRLVKTLVNRGYLIEEKGHSSRYRLGIKLLIFSQLVYEQIDLGRISDKYMKILSDATDQTSQLGILQQGSVMYISQVLPRKPVSIIAPLHTPVPINLSACGKVLCAWLGQDEQKVCVDVSELKKATKISIIDKNEYIAELEKVKSLGFAMDNEEFAKGIGCIAAPIFDHTGKIIAAVGITGHIAAYKNEIDFDKIKDKVLKTAQNISKEIGYNSLEKEIFPVVI